MTALRRKAIQLMEQMPEEQVAYIVQYMQVLKDKGNEKEGENITPKMRAFLELEEMLSPAPQEIDYDKELAEMREERYGSFD